MPPCPCISDPPDHASSASRTSTVSVLPAATTISSTPPASVMSRRAASTTASVAGGRAPTTDSESAHRRRKFRSLTQKYGPRRNSLSAFVDKAVLRSEEAQEHVDDHAGNDPDQRAPGEQTGTFHELVDGVVRERRDGRDAAGKGTHMTTASETVRVPARRSLGNALWKGRCTATPTRCRGWGICRSSC